MDGEAPPTFAVIGSQASDPGHGRFDGVRPVTRWDRGAQPDEEMSPGVALPVPGPAPADGDLQLDHRLEPVDVGSLEQADLDQAHGPGRIATPDPA